MTGTECFYNLMLGVGEWINNYTPVISSIMLTVLGYMLGRWK